jgi:hypothetical protein
MSAPPSKEQASLLLQAHNNQLQTTAMDDLASEFELLFTPDEAYRTPTLFVATPTHSALDILSPEERAAVSKTFQQRIDQEERMVRASDERIRAKLARLPSTLDADLRAQATQAIVEQEHARMQWILDRMTQKAADWNARPKVGDRVGAKKDAIRLERRVERLHEKLVRKEVQRLAAATTSGVAVTKAERRARVKKNKKMLKALRKHVPLDEILPGLERMTMHEQRKEVQRRKKVALEGAERERAQFMNRNRSLLFKLWASLTPKQHMRRRQERMAGVVQMIQYRSDYWHEQHAARFERGENFLAEFRDFGHPLTARAREHPKGTRLLFLLDVFEESVWEFCASWNPMLHCHVLTETEVQELIDQALRLQEQMGADLNALPAVKHKQLVVAQKRAFIEDKLAGVRGDVRLWTDMKEKLRAYDPTREFMWMVRMQFEPLREDTHFDKERITAVGRCDFDRFRCPERIATEVANGPLKQAPPMCGNTNPEDWHCRGGYILNQQPLRCDLCFLQHQEILFCSEGCRARHVEDVHPQCPEAVAIRDKRELQQKVKEQEEAAAAATQKEEEQKAH